MGRVGTWSYYSCRRCPQHPPGLPAPQSPVGTHPRVPYLTLHHMSFSLPQVSPRSWLCKIALPAAPTVWYSVPHPPLLLLPDVQLAPSAIPSPKQTHPGPAFALPLQPLLLSPDSPVTTASEGLWPFSTPRTPVHTASTAQKSGSLLLIPIHLVDSYSSFKVQAKYYLL